MADRQIAEELQAEIRLELRQLLETPGGRYLFWQIISSTGFFVPEASMDPQAACFNEGKRWIGAQVLDLVFTHAPETFMLMREEGVARDAILSVLETEEEENGD